MLALKEEMSIPEILHKLGISPAAKLVEPLTFSAIGGLHEAAEQPVLAFCKDVETAETLLYYNSLHPKSVLLVPTESMTNKALSNDRIIRIDNPKAVFFRLLQHLLDNVALRPSATPRRGTSRVEPTAILSPRVTHGDRLYVGHNCVIGGVGFGFIDLPDLSRLRVPHLSGVVIGNDVEVGDNTVIHSGVLEPTTLADGVKIDSNVLIGHGAYIGSESLVVGGAVICGSAKLGNRCWIGPNSVISNSVSIGDGAHIGLGCVVTNDVAPGSKWIGNPPRRIA